MPRIDLGLDGQAERQGGPGDEFRRASGPVDPQVVAGMALEEDAEVRRDACPGVAAGHVLEDTALGAEDAHFAAVLGQQRRQAFGGDIVADQPLGPGDDRLGERPGQVGRLTTSASRASPSALAAFL